MKDTIPVKHRNKDGFSALDYAAYVRSPETVKILLSHGADPNALAGSHLRRGGDNAKNVSVLMQLLDSNYQVDHDAIVRIIEQLVTAGVDINYQNSIGHTALHLAVFYAENRNPARLKGRDNQVLNAEERAAVVVALLNAGADKSFNNDENRRDLIRGIRGAGFETIFGIEKEEDTHGRRQRPQPRRSIPIPKNGSQ